MAKLVNGNIGWIITLLVIGAGVVASYAVWAGSVAEMKPAVHLNTQHRVTDEIDTPYIKGDIAAIKEKVESIESIQQQILIEVKK